MNWSRRGRIDAANWNRGGLVAAGANSAAGPPRLQSLLSLALILVLVASLASRAAAAEWPLTGSLGAHDPTVIREGNAWWCFATGFGVPVKTSADGLAWQTAQPRSLFTSEDSWWRTWAPRMGNLDVWAPDVHRFNGRVWLYYCVSEFGSSNSAIGLMSCTSLATGDWRDDGFVLGSRAGDSFNAIDPNLAVDANGNPWLAYGSWFDGIHIVALDPATMKPTGPSRGIAQRPNGIEGANVVYANGWYYLFVSIDVCCQGVNSTYKISYGRAASITGPYLDKNGTSLMNAGGTLLEVGGDRWKGPGGQSVVDTGNGWIIARHAYDANANGAPTLRIADLYWDANGWPTFDAPAAPPPPPAPSITRAPVSVTVAPASPVSLNVAATGSTLAYQWSKDGNPLAGATGATLVIASAQASDTGRYTVAVTNPGGTVTSAPATVVVGTPLVGRLVNLSVRTRAGAGDQTLIVGFVISGIGTKPLLLRGTGPTLAALGVSSVLPDPKLELYRDQTLLASNDSWAAAPNVADIRTAGGDKLAGLTLQSQEAVLLQSLAARDYTAQLKDATGQQGVALVEVFDTDIVAPGTPTFVAQPRLSNVSARAQVGTGENVLIAGFVINGNVPRRLLIRGLGATLASFGVSGVLADPQLQLFDSAGTLIAANDDWSTAPNPTEIAAANGGVIGTVPLAAKDSVLLITVAAGAYTAQVSGVAGTTGVALIEVYDVP